MLHCNMPKGVSMADRRAPPSEPARVYPAPDITGQWIVEAPARAASPDGGAEPQFSSHAAAALALRYAYEQYGRARFFSS
jgi:hypothetical protein